MIQFKILKSDFKKSLYPVFKNIPSSVILPSLEYVRFESNGSLKVSSTDLETSVVYDSKVDVGSEFSFCVDGKDVNSFITRALDENINITVTSSRVILESGGFKASLPEGRDSDFPVISKKKIGLFIVSSKSLISKLKTALQFVSIDDLRPSMTGVYFDFKDGLLNIVSTDSHRLYYNTLSIESRIKEFKFILPPKSCRLIIESFRENEPVTIGMDDNMVSFSGEKTTLISRKINSNYPNYNVVIPDNKYEFFILRKNLKSFLYIANQFVNKSTNQVNLTIKNGIIFFSGGNKDFDSEFEYKIPIHGQTNIPYCRFAVNSRFLLQALTINPKDHAVSIKHSGESHKAMIIDSCLLLMPIMMNE